MALSPLRRKLLERYAAEAEFRRCARDAEYFLTNYYYIKSEQAATGRELFKLYPYQQDDIRTLTTNQKVIFGKCRQLGITTLAMAHSGWEMFFATGRYELLVVSKSDEDAQTNLEMLKHGYQWLPEWMLRKMPKRVDDSAAVMTLEFPDKRRVKATSMVGTPKRGAGKTATRLVLDEHALMEKPSEVYRALDASTLSSIMAGRQRGDMRAVFIIISTFRGAQNMFAQLFKTAHYTPEASSWTAVFHPAMENRFLPAEAGLTWDEMTPQQFEELWKRKRDSEYKTDTFKFYQEYPRSVEEALSESGHSRFPHLPSHEECAAFPYAAHLVTKGTKVTLDLLDEDDEGWDLAPLRMLVAPDEWDRKKTYVIGADPASGNGKDYSVAYVMAHGAEPGATDIVAYYHSNVADPATFAQDLSRMGRYFAGEGQPRGALIAVERSNDSSGIVINQLQSSLRYGNLFRYTARDRVSARTAPVVGWPQDKRTKVEAIDAMARQFELREEDGLEYVHTNLSGIGPELREQLGNFIIEESASGNMKMHADGGGHDDHVMAASITLAVLERTKPKKKNLTEPDKVEGIPLSSLTGAFTRFDGTKFVKAAKAEAAALQEESARAFIAAERDRHLTERYERTRA